MVGGIGSILEPEGDDIEAGLPDNDDASMASMQSSSTNRSGIFHRTGIAGHRRTEDQDTAASLSMPLLEEGQSLSGQEADVTTGGGNEVMDVQGAIYSSLGDALEFIQRKGVERLGSFQVPVKAVSDLVASRDVLTLGSAFLHRDDWETLWRRRLGTLPALRKGDAAMVEVTAHVVTIRNAAGADDAGIINPLLHCFQDGSCGMHVFGLPAVKAVVAFKWQTWAKRYLYWELACYLVWLGSFQVFTLLFVDEVPEATLRQVLATTKGKLTVVSDVTALLGMAPFLYVEAMMLLEYGAWGWFSVWNVLDVVAYANQILITFCHLSREGVASDKLSVMVCIQVLLLWIKVQYFARVLQPMENPFVETITKVVSAVKWYLVVLGLLLWGYTCAFYMLFRRDEVEQFSNIPHALLTTFSLVLGSFDMSLVYKSRNPTAAAFLSIIGVFTMSMVLLNCLIALLADAAGKVRDDGGQLFTHSRAQIIDELETCVPRLVRQKQTTWYPAYVHYLEVNREKVDSTLFPNIEKNKAEASRRELVDKVSSLEGEVAATRAELKRLTRLLEAVLDQATGGPAAGAPRRTQRKTWL